MINPPLIVTVIALWILLSIPFGVFVGKILKGCDTLDNSRYKRSVNDVSHGSLEARRCDDVNHAHPPNIK